MPEIEDALAQIDRWEVPHAAALVCGPDGPLAARGDVDRRRPVASITKVATAMAVWVAVEEETLTLDDPAGPEGSTVRHLLAHTSGLAFDRPTTLSAPGNRRIYSNVGFDLLGHLVAERSGFAFVDYLGEAVLAPLGMADTALEGSPAKDLWSTAADLARLAAELLRPTLVAPETHAMATSVAFPGVAGVLPGVGSFDPNDWGLGVEIKGAKHPHWSGRATAPTTFGHFGGAGTFLWVDPTRDLACIGLSGREFGPWAMAAWPRLADAVVAAHDPRHEAVRGTSSPPG